MRLGQIKIPKRINCTQKQWEKKCFRWGHCSCLCKARLPCNPWGKASWNETILWAEEPWCFAQLSTASSCGLLPWSVSEAPFHPLPQLTRVSPESTSRSLRRLRPSRRSLYRSPTRHVTRARWEFTHLVKVFFCTASRSSAGATKTVCLLLNTNRQSVG